MTYLKEVNAVEMNIDLDQLFLKAMAGPISCMGEEDTSHPGEEVHETSPPESSFSTPTQRTLLTHRHNPPATRKHKSKHDKRARKRQAERLAQSKVPSMRSVMDAQMADPYETTLKAAKLQVTRGAYSAKVSTHDSLRDAKTSYTLSDLVELGLKVVPWRAK